MKDNGLNSFRSIQKTFSINLLECLYQNINDIADVERNCISIERQHEQRAQYPESSGEMFWFRQGKVDGLIMAQKLINSLITEYEKLNN